MPWARQTSFAVAGPGTTTVDVPEKATTRGWALRGAAGVSVTETTPRASGPHFVNGYAVAAPGAAIRVATTENIAKMDWVRRRIAGSLQYEFAAVTQAARR